MKPQPASERLSLYENILTSLLNKQDFSIAELDETPKHPLITRRIVDQLLQQGLIRQLPDQSADPRFQWQKDPRQVDISHWVSGLVSHCQIPAAPPQDRPRERLSTLGPTRLKLSELLAILIRSGRPGESALQAGEKIAGQVHNRLEQLPELGLPELKKISTAVSEPAWCQIMAGIELGRRVQAAATLNLQDRPRLTCPDDAIKYCLTHFNRLSWEARQEEVHMITLDSKSHPIASHLVTIGTLRNNLVHPREVFRHAIRDAANAFILVHNHPSGDPTPSDMDLHVTTRLEDSGEIIGITLIDHIVVAAGKAVSIQQFRDSR